ncbi:MAG: Crp/Fnr family transcriptional regulator [Armatimonadetes bacterium]|nr:Crp/Fnr family transcriptional regulator [Armatimonadota bacterium]
MLEAAQPLELPAGTHLIQTGEVPSQVSFVESGLLAVSEVSEHGTGRITVLAGPEAIVPIGLLSESAEPDRVEVWAMVYSRVLRVDANSLRSRLAEGGPLDTAVRDYLIRLCQRLGADLQINKDFNLLQRTAATLLELAERLQPEYRLVEEGRVYPASIVPISHDVLARRLGTVREVATESLGQLREEGYIETLYRRVEIEDPEGLQARAGGAYRQFSC